jgi:hypothetical protein
MAIVGDVVSEGARRAALGDISRVLGRAAHLAREESVDLLQAKARAPFQLVETDHGTLSRFLDRFRASALWVDEGTCFNRAMLGAHMLDELRGFGMGPADDVFAGAIAIKRNHVAERYVADFHAALAVKVRHMDELQVVDMVPGSPRMQPLSSWAPGETPIVVRPYAGTGVGTRSTWVGGGYFDGAAANLQATWRAAEQFGVTVRGLGHEAPRTVRPAA